MNPDEWETERDGVRDALNSIQKRLERIEAFQGFLNVAILGIVFVVLMASVNRWIFK